MSYGVGKTIKRRGEFGASTIASTRPRVVKDTNVHLQTNAGPTKVGPIDLSEEENLRQYYRRFDDIEKKLMEEGALSEDSDEPLSEDDDEDTDSSNSIASERRKKDRVARDMSWLIREPTFGGPIVPDGIPSFGGHVAFGLETLASDPPIRDRGVLRAYDWEIDLIELRTWVLPPDVRSTVVASGLDHLKDCMTKHLDLPLLSAFVERWQPDTNTFHMPFGEMTILLHDVAKILQIPIAGHICNVSEEEEKKKEEDNGSHMSALCDLFDMTVDEIHAPYKETKAAPIYDENGVLAEAVQQLTFDGMLETQVQGYLLLLLGSTLFVNKSEDRIQANILHLLSDVKRVPRYAWGAGVLAYLYRQLGIATRADCRELTGCLTLLPTWIYEYFPTLRSTREITQAVDQGQPRSLCWDYRRRGPGAVTDVHELRQYRRLLDGLSPDMVNWLPYGDRPDKQHPRTLFFGCIRFLDIVEPYHPDRSLRQFGFRQTIPVPMPRSDENYRPVKSNEYTVNYGPYTDHLWLYSQYHRVILTQTSSPAIPRCQVDDNYMQWFTSHSHPKIVDYSTVKKRDSIINDVGRLALERLALVYDMPPDQQFEHFQRLTHELKPLVRRYHGQQNSLEMFTTMGARQG